jgi:hypothetical protein
LAKGGIPEVVGKKTNKIKENFFPRAILNEAERYYRRRNYVY